MDHRSTNKRRIRAKLIFNSGSGVAGESPVQLMDVIREMQAWRLVPVIYWSNRVAALAGTNAILGIIPTRTQNNAALSLGIPADIPPAIVILSNPQANEMRLATGLHFPRGCQLGVNHEQ